MDENEIAEKLKLYLKSSTNPNKKIFGSYSLREIYENVKNGTPEGKKLIEITRPIIEELIEGWEIYYKIESGF